MKRKGSAKQVLVSVAFAAGLMFSLASEEGMAAGLPINFNTQFSMTEHTKNLTGEKVNRTSLTNNMSFSSLLPSGGMTSQKMNMSFSQANSFSGGNKSSSSNMTLFYGFNGNHYNFNNSFSMVENANSSAATQKNKNMNMGLSVSWPKLPSMSVMFTSSGAGAQKSESNLMSMSYALSRTSFSFNSIESTSRTKALNSAKSKSKTMSVSRQHVSSKKLTVRSNLNVNRSSSFAGIYPNKNKQDSMSLSVYDTHIKAVPLNLNMNMQKSSQSTYNNFNSQTTNSLNAFTTVMLPGETRMNTSYNLAGTKNPDAPGKTRSRVLNLNLTRVFFDKAKVNYTYTRTTADGAAGDDSTARNSMMSVFMPVSKSTTVNIQRGSTYSKSSLVLAPPPPTKFSNITVTSKLQGGVTTTYQYNVSETDVKTINESTNLTMPITRDISMAMFTTKKRMYGTTNSSLGMRANMLLSRNMSVSTTWTEQKTKGVKSTLWNMGVMTMMRNRSTLSMGLSSQKNVDSTQLSATLGLSMYL